MPFPLLHSIPGKALDFLYATMSLPDKTDYSKEFYLENINAPLKAREEPAVGKVCAATGIHALRASGQDQQ